MRRLFAPRGGSARQDVPVPADADVSSEDADYESWVAHQNAKRGGRMATRRAAEMETGAPNSVIAATNVAADTIWRRNVHCGAHPEMSPRHSPGLRKTRFVLFTAR